MPSYAVYLHLGLLEAMPKSEPARRQILDFVRRLQTYPTTPGDFTDTDASQRVRQIKIIGNHAVTYWLDDPAKAVMIVDVCPAGA